MNARVTFRPETLHQTGTAGQLLLWLQEEPKRGRNTNITMMARTFCMNHGVQTLTAKAMLQKMVNTQMLSRYGTKKRSNFFINYFHKDIPGYVLEKAPAEDRERVANLRQGLKGNQHIEDNGVVVTEAPKKEEKKEETTITANETTQSSNQVKSEPEQTEEETLKSSSDASEENTTSVPIKVVDTERGLSISITLNLNINK